MYTTVAPPLWERKKHLREKNHDLHQQVQALRYDLNQANSRTAVAEEESRQWRAAYETLASSAEIKADTEGAFRRGEAFARMKFASWLRNAYDEILDGGE